MKRFTALLLAALLVFALAACGGGTDGGTPGTPSATPTAPSTTPTTPAAPDSVVDLDADPVDDGPTTLKVWMDNDDWANRVIEGWNAKYPQCEIDYQNVGNVDSHAKLTLDGPAGVGADVYFLPHDQMPRNISDGLAEALPTDLQARYQSLLLETANITASRDGLMYGVPIQVENIAMFYNKDLWGPNPPQTFEEIIEFSRTYNNPANNDWTLVWQVKDFYHSIVFLTAGGLEIFGPNHDNYKTPNFNSPGAEKGLGYFLQMKQCFDVPEADANWDNSVARFQRGEVPLCISGPWAIGDAVANGVNFGTDKFPTFEGNQPWCFSGVIVGCVSSYSENLEWAYRFLDFLVSDEGAGIMYEIKGTMTSLKNIDNVPGLGDDVLLAGIAEQSPYTIPMPMIPEVEQMWAPGEEMLSLSWDGELNIQQAMEKAMDTYVTLLAGAGKSID